MTGLAHAGWAASRALARGDLKAYDRWARKARRAGDDLARRLAVVAHCRTCGDVVVVSTGRDRCVVCRAMGKAS